MVKLNIRRSIKTLSSLTKHEMAAMIAKLFSLPSNDMTKPELDEIASKIHVTHTCNRSAVSAGFGKHAIVKWRSLSFALQGD